MNVLLYGQANSLSKQETILTKLRKEEMVTGEHIGEAGQYSDSYRIAKSLWDISSIQALIKLTDDSSPVVRCYAFLGLIEKKADKEILKKIIHKHQNDTAKITTMNGCIISTDVTVISYMKSELDNK
jgi:hypothetical protein